MDWFLDDGDIKLAHGSALDVLAALPAESVQTVVTSPPYWGLRDYGTCEWDGGDAECDHTHETKHQQRGATSQRHGRSNEEAQRNENYRDVCGRCGARRVDSQLGLEPTPEQYVESMVAVFREVWRVLRPDGTVWLNLGDSYAANRSYQVSDGKHQAHEFGGSNAMSVPDGLKPKDLVGIPWRVAFALQADGWYLRSDIIWAKPNPMPESVSDRPTKAHEYVFLLAKQPQYYYDADSIREPPSPSTIQRWGDDLSRRGVPSSQQFKGSPVDPRSSDYRGEHSCGVPSAGRNARSVWKIDQDAQQQGGPTAEAPHPGQCPSVWDIATQPTPEAHFVTYPEELVRRCILAGSSEAGECSACGAPWTRQVERTPMVLDRSARTHPMGRTRTSGTMLEPPTSTTTGWAASCQCGSPFAVPQTVLDPFVGSGTTALVARRHGRRAIGIDLNESYLRIAARRTAQLSLLAEGGGA